MNPMSEKYGLDLVLRPKTIFVAKITKQCLFYRRDV